MNKSIWLIILFLSLLSGCKPKFRFDSIMSVNLNSVSLSSSNISLTVGYENQYKKAITISSLDVISRDIEDLSVQLINPVVLSPDEHSVDIPLKVNYSLGSALSLINRMQKGFNDNYAVTIKVKLSKGSGAPIGLTINKKLSKEQLQGLISKLKKR